VGKVRLSTTRDTHPQDALERLRPGEVKDKEGTEGIAVVDAVEGAEAVLACGRRVCVWEAYER
jgi:hypothetical protein